jgi:hypothetical protein
MSAISISIDVTQLDKARFKTIQRRNGKSATYAELVLIETPGGQYGDFMVKQSCTKEEREAKHQMPIIGNGKRLGQGAAKTPASAPKRPPEASKDVSPIEDTDIPF